MKRFALLVIAATLGVLLYSQVPATFIRSGMINGGASAQSSGVHGWATFDTSGSSIASLVTNGCVTGVTYTSTGVYQVALSGCPSGYGVTFGATTDSGFPIEVVNPSSSQTPSGFQMAVVAANTGFGSINLKQVTVVIP